MCFLSLYSCTKMSEARFSQDELTCSVCLDLLKDPVTIQCGHSYCKSCITGCWDQEDQMRVYSCPQCRQTFSPRPPLARNTMLTELVEKLKTKLPADYYAGAGDVQCDVYTGRKCKAVKSCLVCQESYCQTHFDRHEEFHSRKPHKVTILYFVPYILFLTYFILCIFPLCLYSIIFALSMERTLLTFHCWLYTLYIIVYVTNKNLESRKLCASNIIATVWTGPFSILTRQCLGL